MSIFSIITSFLGLVKPTVAAGKEVSGALNPYVTIDPNDATLWHTPTYDKKGNIRCTVCQMEIPRGFVTQLCSEAVRRRQKVEA